MAADPTPGSNHPMKKIILPLLSATLLFACTDEAGTRRTLNNHGFINISITGYELFECSEDDVYSTGFTATNHAGQVVRGTVCCGMFSKGCTVRF